MEWGFTISRVQQSKPNNCWDACVEMLTGIDQDLFDPELSPQVMTFDTSGASRFTYQNEIVGPNQSINHWKVWLSHLGYDLVVHKSRPSQAAIRIVRYGQHAVVELPNCITLDPGGWSVLVGKTNLWVTITPTPPTKPIRL